MSKRFLIWVFSTALFGSCVKDKPEPQPEPVINLSNSQKVWVLNEGNFMSGNASVSLYDTGNNSVTENYFDAVNNLALGDVGQSMVKAGNAYYLVINNSGKIVVTDLQLKFKQTISGFNSPRYLLPVSNQKAYVSDLYANAISIVDLSNGSKTGSIPCKGWTEQMVMLYNKVYVSNINSNYIYVIDAIQDKLSDSIEVGKGCGNLVFDKFDRLWALKGQHNAEAAKLWKINPLNLNDKTAFTFDANDKPGSLCINGQKDTLYYFNNGICRFTIQQTELKAALIEKGNKNFYAMGINPLNGDIYASDALDYIQKSNIYIYKSNTLELKHQFKAGIISGYFYFD
jgi:YVTN family beta-propeller protein